MRPGFIIYADSNDRTLAILDRLVELKVTDSAGWESDTLSIDLDDRDGNMAPIAQGTELELYLGYEETDMPQMGIYIVDEIAYKGAPRKISIHAKSADMQKDLKSPRTATWHDTTIQQIVSTIAKRYSLEPNVDPELGEIAVPHLDQTEESDLNILTRLAKQYDAVAKPAYKRLHFLKTGEARLKRRDTMPKVEIQAKDMSSYDVRYAVRKKYEAVTAYYYDVDKAKRVPVTVGNAKGSTYILSPDYPDEKQAKDAAAARLALLKRWTGVINFSLPGNPWLRAETVVELSGARDKVDGRWLVSRAEHHLTGSGGYVTSVSGTQPE